MFWEMAFQRARLLSIIFLCPFTKIDRRGSMCKEGKELPPSQGYLRRVKYLYLPGYLYEKEFPPDLENLSAWQ